MSQHELQRLLPRHFEVINLTLAGNGPKEIAQALGMTPQAVSLITKSPNVQSELARRRAGIERDVNSELASGPSRAKDRLNELALPATEKLNDLLESADHRVQLGAANSILEKVFGGEQGSKHQVLILDQNAMNLLQLAMMESMKENRKLKEVQCVERAPSMEASPS